jgi:hypothetical protein
VPDATMQGAESRDGMSSWGAVRLEPPFERAAARLRPSAARSPRAIPPGS